PYTTLFRSRRASDAAVSPPRATATGPGSGRGAPGRARRARVRLLPDADPAERHLRAAVGCEPAAADPHSGASGHDLRPERPHRCGERPGLRLTHPAGAPGHDPEHAGAAGADPGADGGADRAADAETARSEEHTSE